jgi:hypothetical protein
MLKAIRQRLSAALLSTLFLFTLTLGFVNPTRIVAAQSTDTTAQSGISWPATQELPTFSQPHHLDVADLSGATGDVNLLFSTLEGLINRRETRIYLFEGNPDEGKATWLNDIHVPYTLYQDPWQVLSRYVHEVKGIIIYDPNLIDTVNIATTLSGLHNGIVVSPELAAKLTAAPYNLPILDDLRGKFTSALDAYTWQFQNLWSQTTHRMLVGLMPGVSVSIPSDNWKNFQNILTETQPVRDSSNRATYDLDLSSQLGGDAVYLRFQDSFPIDGWGPSVHQVTVKADGQVIGQFTPCTDSEEGWVFDHGGSACDTNPENPHRFADGNTYFIYRFAPPAGTKQLVVSVDMENEYQISASAVQPQVSSDQKQPFGNLRDYAVANKAMVFWLDLDKANDIALFKQILASVKYGTPYLGWFNDEPDGVKLTSSYGVYVLAADYANNLTVFSGVRASIRKQQTVAAPALQNKIYITFTVSDGDNLQYDQHFLRKSWSDPARGSIPLNWTISPMLEEAAPAILSYYQRTATKNDLLMAGPSGAGYFNPSYWPQDNLNTFLRQSSSYLRRAGMDIVDVIDDPTSLPASIVQSYHDQLGVNGLVFTSFTGKTDTAMVGKLPVATQLVINSKDELANIQQQAANWDGKSPLFLSILLIGWNNSATDAQFIAQQLGSNYVPVRADQYFQLFREANGLSPQS